MKWGCLWHLQVPMGESRMTLGFWVVFCLFVLFIPQQLARLVGESVDRPLNPARGLGLRRIGVVIIHLGLLSLYS